MGSVEESRKRPNILLIHADQHRFDCLGAYGNPDVSTGAIDGLAADGVRFDNSFCPFPVCTPSRYSLLSGIYVHEHRGWTNHCTLPPGTETFPSILKEAGYRTKAVGKMHFTPTYLDVGFDEMILAEQDGPGRWDDDYHRDLRDAGLVDVNDLEDQRSEYRKNARPEYWQTFGALPTNLPAAFHSTEWIGEHAVKTLEGWGPSGNLLMVGFVKPHHPFDPPREWCDKLNPDDLSVLPGWTDRCLPRDLAFHKGYFPHETLDESVLRRVMAHYYATIEQIDHHVRRMVDVLKRKGMYDQTLIIYTGDHGDYMGFHHLLLKGGYMYDPLVKVPLIIKFPQGGRRGASDALVSNVDVGPTILAQAGCRPGERMGGLDLSDETSGREVVFAESRKGTLGMARTRTRKLMVHEPKGETLLFDLERDPFEVTDRSEDAKYAADRRELTDALEGWRPFDSLPETYLDEDAPVIDRPNVPPRDDDHRETMIAYCSEKMRSLPAWQGDSGSS